MSGEGEVDKLNAFLSKCLKSKHVQKVKEQLEEDGIKYKFLLGVKEELEEMLTDAGVKPLHREQILEYMETKNPESKMFKNQPQAIKQPPSNTNTNSNSNSNNSVDETKSGETDPSDDNSPTPLTEEEKEKEIAKRLEEKCALENEKHRIAQLTLEKQMSHIVLSLFGCSGSTAGEKSNSNSNSSTGTGNGNIKIKINTAVLDFLKNDIPIVTLFGPSRQGKSSLINNLMSNPNACPVSNSADQALTKGAWICLYTNPRNPSQSFYLIDTEGLSHDVTPFTMRTFYACYAISNVMIWNDKVLNNRQFQEYMSKLGSKMKQIKKSKQKPTFLYLLRDADIGDSAGRYDTYKNLDGYINGSSTFKYLRDARLFASVHGCELDAPRRSCLSEETMRNLSSTISKLCSSSVRFTSDLCQLTEQIRSINSSSADPNKEDAGLSLGVKLIGDNPILAPFLFDTNNNDAKHVATRTLNKNKFANANKWNETQMCAKFEQAMCGYLRPLIKNKLVDSNMKAKLNANFEQFQREVKAKRQREWEATKSNAVKTLKKVGKVAAVVYGVGLVTATVGAIVLGPVVAGPIAAVAVGVSAATGIPLEVVALTAFVMI